MLADLLYELHIYFSPLNVFKYITVRAALAGVTSLILSWYFGPKIIALMRRKQIGEIVREDAPEGHHKKQGTPTMGGIIMLLSVGSSLLMWAKLNNFYMILAIVALYWMGIVGFVDDYLKNIKKKERGLIGRYKLVGQVLLGLIVGSAIYFHPELSLKGINANTSVPFFKNFEIELGLLYIPFVVFVITATSNAVNLTDGLDGLAAGLLAICSVVFAAIAYVTSNTVFSDYLNIIYLKGTAELTIFSLAMFGASIGFLWFNAHPAEIFMGDVGSLSFGGALGVLAVLLKKELILPIIGGVFFIETLSVILQVSYFKYTRRKYGTPRRIFKMTPLHHHFEKKGWHEAKIVTRFWIIGILLALFTLTTFKIR
ncbi:MAG: phospho-N-acetylmuramoyl-pentapeptide-transferase [Calditrichia bacterium]